MLTLCWNDEEYTINRKIVNAIIECKKNVCEQISEHRMRLPNTIKHAHTQTHTHSTHLQDRENGNSSVTH